MWIQYTNVFKRYQTEIIFQRWKTAVTPKIIGGFYPKSNLTTFYNYILVYKIWFQFTNLFKSYGTETIFQSWKRAITPKIIGGFYPKSNWTYILWLYTCV